MTFETSSAGSNNFGSSSAKSSHGGGGGDPSHSEGLLLAQAFDTSRLHAQHPNSATREVDVSAFHLSVDADEVDSLPGSYLDGIEQDDPTTQLYRSGYCANHRMKRNAPAFATVADPVDGDNYDTPYKAIDIDFPGAYNYGWDPFHFTKTNWLSASIAIASAVALAGLGLFVSIKSLRPGVPGDNIVYGNRAEFQFGGSVGGILGGIEMERNRQMRLGNNAVAKSDIYRHGGTDSVSVEPNSIGARAEAHSYDTPNFKYASVTSSTASYGGFGPPQIVSEHPKARLSSAPLTSYAPPVFDDGYLSSSVVVLNQKFHGAYMDVAVLPFDPTKEVPVVWDPLQSGGEVVKSVFGTILKLVQCSEEGGALLLREYEELQPQKEEQAPFDAQLLAATSAHNESNVTSTTEDEIGEQTGDEDTANGRFDAFDSPLKTGLVYTSTYVNVDCTTSSGVSRAVRHGLATSDLIDVVYTPNVLDAARIFFPPTDKYGRMVLVMRNPIERALANFEYLQTTNEEASEMTLEQYSKSDLVEDNFLTRTLSGNLDKEIIPSDLILAREILQRKFVIGLYSRLGESILRFEWFFSWVLDPNVISVQEAQIQRELGKHYNNYANLSVEGGVQHPGLNANTLANLTEKNRWDLSLFAFCEFLYDYQGRVLFGTIAN